MHDMELLLEQLERLAIVLDELMPKCAELVRDAIALLKEQEAVVRCKDCKRRGSYECPVYVGGDGIYSEPDDWFCADGER